MAIVYILGCFLLMLGMVACILAGCYSLARGLWFGALIGGLAAILCLTFLLDCVDGVELAYAQTITEAQRHAD